MKLAPDCEPGLDLSALPNDIDALQALVREQAALLRSKEIEIERLTARAGEAEADAVRPLFGEA